MKLTLCAVFDLGTQTFGRPFTVNHTHQATRSFIDEVNNPDSEISRHLEDYELFALGTVDDQTGRLEERKERLARAIDLQRSIKE